MVEKKRELAEAEMRARMAMEGPQLTDLMARTVRKVRRGFIWCVQSVVAVLCVDRLCSRSLISNQTARGRSWLAARFWYRKVLSSHPASSRLMVFDLCFDDVL